MALQKAQRRIVSGAVKKLYDSGAKFKIETIRPGNVIIFREQDPLDSTEEENYYVVIVYAQNKSQTKCAELQTGYHYTQQFEIFMDHGMDCVVLATIPSLQVPT